MTKCNFKLGMSFSHSNFSWFCWFICVSHLFSSEIFT